MKLLIAGSRKIDKTYIEGVYYILDVIVEKNKYEVTEVISGGAKGVDTYGEQWAEKHDIPVLRIVPDWKQGKGAGMERNTKLVEVCDVAAIFWDGHSKGTHDTLRKMLKSRKPLFENRFAWITNKHNITPPNLIVGPWEGSGVQ